MLAFTVRYSLVVAMSCACRSDTSFWTAGFRLPYGVDIGATADAEERSEDSARLALDRLALINLCCFCNWAFSGSMASPCLMVDNAASNWFCSDWALARR